MAWLRDAGGCNYTEIAECTCPIQEAFNVIEIVLLPEVACGSGCPCPFSPGHKIQQVQMSGADRGEATATAVRVLPLSVKTIPLRAHAFICPDKHAHHGATKLASQHPK